MSAPDDLEREDTATHVIASPPAPLLAGEYVQCGQTLGGRYVLDAVIGRGGMSVVYRARDLQISSGPAPAGCVALKVLRSERRADAMAVLRLQREFRQMQRLSHPGIVRVFDLDCHDGVWFMTMEVIAGQTLKAWTERQPRNHDEVMRVIAACCEALQYAHSLDILHGDFKPTNVLVSEGGMVKLIDFGSAMSATPLYASPQVLSGKDGEVRDDVFSLACLSYGLLSGGRHPFGRRPSLEDGRAKSSPDPVSRIPAGLFEVIERGLAAQRDERQASVEEFRRQLLAAEARWRPDVVRAAILARSHGDAAASSAMRLPVPVPRRSQGLRNPAGPLTRLALLTLVIVAAGVLIQPAAREEIAVAARPATITSVEPTPAVASRAQPIAALPTDSVAPLDASAGIISFEADSIHASAAQPLVAVSVRRQHNVQARGAFLWHVEGGTAYPGVDYRRMQPQLVTFLEGQSVRTLFIPLINTRAALPPNRPRSFTVALAPVAGGPSLGRLHRVTVTIDPIDVTSRMARYQARADR